MCLNDLTRLGEEGADLPAIITPPLEQNSIDVEALTPRLMELAKHLDNFSLETDAAMVHIEDELALTCFIPLLRDIGNHSLPPQGE